MKLKSTIICTQLFLEQVPHNAVLCLNQGLEEGLAMNLQLVHWFFLNVILDIFSMDRSNMSPKSILFPLLFLLSIVIASSQGCQSLWCYMLSCTLPLTENASFLVLLSKKKKSLLHALKYLLVSQWPKLNYVPIPESVTGKWTPLIGLSESRITFIVEVR